MIAVHVDFFLLIEFSVPVIWPKQQYPFRESWISRAPTQASLIRIPSPVLWTLVSLRKFTFPLFQRSAPCHSNFLTKLTIFSLWNACKTERIRSYYQLTDRTSLVGCYCCGWLNGQTNQWQNHTDPIRTCIYTWCRRHAFTVLLVGGYYKAYTTHSRMHTTRAHPHKTKTKQIRTTATSTTTTTKTRVHEMKLFNKTERKRKIKWNKWLSQRKRAETKEKSQL